MMKQALTCGKRMSVERGTGTFRDVQVCSGAAGSFTLSLARSVAGLDGVAG